MSLHKSRWFFIVSTMVVLIIVLAFTGGLNIATFKKNYTSSLVRSYTVVGGETVRKIEYAVKYGKPLSNFYGMKELLAEVVQNSQDIKAVKVVLPDGKIAYDLNGTVSNEDLPNELIKEVNFKENSDGIQYISELYHSEYHTFLPLRNREGEWIGSLDLIFDEGIVEMHSNKYLKSNLEFMIVLALIAALILVFLFFKIRTINDKGEILEKRILLIVLCVLAVSQVVYAVNNIFMFRNAYNSIARANTAVTAKIIEKDISKIVEKGIELESLYEIDVWMDKVISVLPEIEGVYIEDDNEKIIYTSGYVTKENYLEFIEENMYVLSLEKSNNELIGKIKAVFSKNYMSQKIRDILIDAATIFVISFFFLFEVLLFMILFIKGRSSNCEKEPGQAFYGGGKTIRTLAFIMFMGAYMSISFIPVLMRQLYQPITGLSEQIVIGLPTSAEMLCCGISTIMAGLIIDKKGWKKAFFFGAAVFGIGLLASGLAWNTAIYITARGISGFGYGFWLMAMRSFAVSVPTELEKSENVSAMNSGAYAGLNCGAVLGGMLADRIGFSRVFYVASIFLIIAVVFTLTYFKGANMEGCKELKSCVPKVQSGETRINAKKFFTDFRVLTFFILIIIPTSICGMFLDYLFPLLAQSLNVSTANTSRAFLLNGMCVIILGPFLSKSFGKKFSTLTTVIIAAVTVATAMLAFSIRGTIASGFIAAILLGLASSFGVAAQSNYYLKLSAVKTFGEGKALGLYSNVEKVGQTFGPIIFGSIIAFGTAKGVGIIGLTFLVLIIVFTLINTRSKSVTKGQTL